MIPLLAAILVVLLAASGLLVGVLWVLLVGVLYVLAACLVSLPIYAALYAWYWFEDRRRDHGR